MPVMPPLIPMTTKPMPVHDINFLFTITALMETIKRGVQVKPNSNHREIVIDNGKNM